MQLLQSTRAQSSCILQHMQLSGVVLPKTSWNLPLHVSARLLCYAFMHVCMCIRADGAKMQIVFHLRAAMEAHTRFRARILCGTGYDLTTVNLCPYVTDHEIMEYTYLFRRSIVWTQIIPTAAQSAVHTRPGGWVACATGVAHVHDRAHAQEVDERSKSRCARRSIAA